MAAKTAWRSHGQKRLRLPVGPEQIADGKNFGARANPVLIESGFALFSLCNRIFGRRTGIHPRIKSEGGLRLKML
jgi:hypothetical protein